MNERFAAHSTFVIKRVYKASPERVFAMWADGRDTPDQRERGTKEMLDILGKRLEII